MKFTKRAMVHSKETRESQKEFWDEISSKTITKRCVSSLLPLPISSSPHHTHALHRANSYGCDDHTISL